MTKIWAFEPYRWSEPDEQHRVWHIGMADVRETFENLKSHLKATGLLPDEYFLFDGEYDTQLQGELPNFDYAFCVPNFGASEGIYLNISLACRDDSGSLKLIWFATDKTLEESRDAFLRMHRIAGECTLMLNGRGFYYGRSEGSKIHDWPEDLLSQMAPDTMRVLFPYQEEGELSFSIIPERLNNLADYAN